MPKSKSAIYEVVLLFVLTSLLFTCSANADRLKRRGIKRLIRGSVVIAADTISPPLDFIGIKASYRAKLFFNIQGEAIFSDGSKKAVGLRRTPTTLQMPPINPGHVNAESRLAVKLGRRTIFGGIRVLAIRKEWLERIDTNYDFFARAIEMRGSHFAAVDEKKLNYEYFAPERAEALKAGHRQNASASLSRDDGITQILSDYESPNYPRDICTRPYIPHTKYGSGIVKWQTSERPRAFFTLKDENTSGSSAASLRCPKKTTPSTDYYVDGIYSILWVYPFRALKVPDHCTVTRQPGGFYCCCNAALTVLHGTCRFVDPRSPALKDWPDNLRICSLNEP